jgi:hypothetical protein
MFVSNFLATVSKQLATSIFNIIKNVLKVKAACWVISSQFTWRYPARI